MSDINFLRVDKIFKTYSGRASRGHQVLKGFSWEARAGRVSGLVGQNGAGKTTMFHILLGLTGCDAGSVAWGEKVLFSSGSPTKNQDLAKMREIFAWLPEHPHLPKHAKGYDLLLEYALFDGVAQSEAQQRRVRAIQDFDLTSFVSKPCGTYSRGQAVLLSLARLSMLDRPVLLLDEPTAGLDFSHALLVRSWIKNQATQFDKCVIVSTHLLPDLYDLEADLIGLHEGARASSDVMASWMASWKTSTPHIPNSSSEA